MTTKVRPIRNTMCNWIIPLVIGVIAGQEVKEIPRMRPYVEAGIRKILALGREISNDVETRVESRKLEKTSIGSADSNPVSEGFIRKYIKSFE